MNNWGTSFAHMLPKKLWNGHGHRDACGFFAYYEQDRDLRFAALNSPLLCLKPNIKWYVT